MTTEQVPTGVRFLNTALMYWPVMKEYAASTYVPMYVCFNNNTVHIYWTNKIITKFCYWWIILIMYKIIMYVCILTTMRWIYGTNKIIKILLLVDYIWSYAYVC